MLARSRDFELLSLLGGGVEPGEEPTESLLSEVFEETGGSVRIRRIVGAYGGPSMTVTYPNGGQVGYETISYDCERLTASRPDMEEVIELG